MIRRVCKDCGKEFEIEDGEIEFYESKGLSLPKRCADCREKRKASQAEVPASTAPVAAGAAVSAAKGSAGSTPKEKRAGASTKTGDAASLHGSTSSGRGASSTEGPSGGGASSSRTTLRSRLIAAALAAALALGGGSFAATQVASHDGEAPDAPAASQTTQGSGAGSSSSQGTSQSAQDQAQDKRPLTFRSERQKKQHFDKHGKEMGFANADAYEQAAAAVARNPKALYKEEKEDGDDVYYLERSDEIVFVSKEGYIRTYFNPGGRSYFDRQ